VFLSFDCCAITPKIHLNLLPTFLLSNYLRPMIQVVCALITGPEGVLVTQRGPTQDQSGKWEFPGGKVQPGETPPQALVREIAEELHLTIMPLEPLPPVQAFTGTRWIELLPFLCRIDAGILTLTEHQAAKWVMHPELAALDWCPADVPVYQQYLRQFGHSL
jgi:8-oxo-dGTP diphosphatase